MLHVDNSVDNKFVMFCEGEGSVVAQDAELRARALNCIADRENVFLRLSQTAHDNLNKEFDQYTINPKTRYLLIGDQSTLISSYVFRTCSYSLNQSVVIASREASARLYNCFL